MKLRNKNLVKIALATLLLGLLIGLSGCGVEDIDISEYEDEVIVLSGLGEKDYEISIGEIKSLECKSIKTHSTSDKIGEVKATGPELEAVLEKYGFTKEDIKSLRFYGEDKYDVPLYADYIKEHDIYLAFGIDGEALDEESRPCRVIIPESDSAYWIRMVNRIEFTLN